MRLNMQEKKRTAFVIATDGRRREGIKQVHGVENKAVTPGNGLPEKVVHWRITNLQKFQKFSDHSIFIF
jgi:hypothetical protein